MDMLAQRRLGATGLVVPPLGVGVWSWGDTRTWDYGKSYTRDDVRQAYKVSLDAGLTFFDTAEMYGHGESERLLGQFRREDERPITIATKFAPLPYRLSVSALWDALEASLARLGVETVNLYQIHWPYTLLDQNALMDMLALAVCSGKTRAVGVSNYGARALRNAHARLARHGVPLASNQVHYSLLHRHPETNGVLDTCRELDIALIAYSPLEQGLLTGKYRVANQDSTPLRGTRRMSRAFRVKNRQKMEPLLQTMEACARTHGKTIGQVALNWLLVRDACIIPIPGAKNGRQAADNAAALGWSLTEAESDQIAQAARPWLASGSR